MKRNSIFIAFGFLFLVVALSYAQEREFKGAVTDDMCGRKHMAEGLTAKDCADQCVAAGSKYALFVPGDAKTYVIDNQDKAKEFAGEDVVVKGSVSEDGKTIRLSSIARGK